MTGCFFDRVVVMEPIDDWTWISLDSTFEKQFFTIFLLSNRWFLSESWCKTVNLSIRFILN